MLKCRRSPVADLFDFIKDPQEGDVRVVRADRYNFATERYARVKSRKDGESDRFE